MEHFLLDHEEYQIAFREMEEMKQGFLVRLLICQRSVQFQMLELRILVGARREHTGVKCSFKFMFKDVNELV